MGAWLHIKKWWWLILASIITSLLLVLGSFFRRDPDAAPNVTSLADLVNDQAKLAEIDVMVEHAKAKVVNEHDKRKINQIMDDDDLNRKRDNLARWATENL